MTTLQLPLLPGPPTDAVLDESRSRQVTEQAIRQCKAHTPDTERARYLEAIFLVARRQVELTCDDVWAELGEANGSSRVGPCMVEARKMGWITRDRAADGASQRVRTHSRLQRGWRSLITQPDYGMPATTITTLCRDRS